MRAINKVILVGNVTRDPQIKETSNGQMMTTFGIATNRQWGTQDGNTHSLAEYHDVVAWSKLAELCNQHLKKGKLVYIEGYLKTRNWEDESGEKKYRTEITIHDMIMLNKRGDIPEEKKQESPEQPQAKAEAASATDVF